MKHSCEHCGSDLTEMKLPGEEFFRKYCSRCKVFFISAEEILESDLQRAVMQAHRRLADMMYKDLMNKG